jgi:hypothetical protein
MSTSPSTANWNFDTPENRAAWDATTSPSSYFAPTVTYGNNNNINDAAAYNDHHRGHQSPGIDSNVLGETTAIRDMEDAEAYVLTLSPGLGTDTAEGPPILEDGSGCLGGRLSVLSVHTTGKEKSTAGQSAGNTPYPNATILFDESEDEDLNIQCGRCENPIAYCHCDNSNILIIPPPIVTAVATVITTQDGEETALPTAEEEDNLPPVEVRIGRGLRPPTDT